MSSFCGFLKLLYLECSCVIQPCFLESISSKASSRPQGKYMHHTHDVHIVCKKESWTWKYTSFIDIICSDAYIKIHVTHCLLWHAYAFTCSHIPSLHDCIHVRGANACYMSFQRFTYYSSYLYLKLWCMLSSITKKGEIESTSAPWVMLVINVNISLVGLIFYQSILVEFNSGVAWTRGCGTSSRC